MDIDFRGGQHSVCREEDGSGNTDIQSLLIGTTTEQSEDEDAHNTCREDGIEGEEGT